MASDRTALGDRMKGYEAVTRTILPRRTYTVLRLDGRAFHSYTRGCEKPFDYQLMQDMDGVMIALCEEISGVDLAYTQSDEISLLLSDFDSVHTEPWFGGVVQKMVSNAASIATAQLNMLRDQGRALFDARVFTLPNSVEVANYFMWRQRDCVRNSISMAAQAVFSHKELQGLSANQLQEKLFTERGINWNDYPVGAKRGRMCLKTYGEETVTWTHKRTGEVNQTTAWRSSWDALGALNFNAEPGGVLSYLIPELPALSIGDEDAPASLVVDQALFPEDAQGAADGVAGDAELIA